MSADENDGYPYYFPREAIITLDVKPIITEKKYGIQKRQKIKINTVLRILIIILMWVIQLLILII